MNEFIDGNEATTSRVTRFGRHVVADAVFHAWAGGDIDVMRAALGLQTNGVDRHYLLSSLVAALYSQRKKSPALANELVQVGEQHLRELPALVWQLERHYLLGRARLRVHEAKRAARSGSAPRPLGGDGKFTLPFISTFDQLCMVFCEAGNYDAAREVWSVAVQIGYIDEAGLARIDALIAKRRRRLSNKSQLDQ